MITEILEDLKNQEDTGLIAYKVHCTLAMIVRTLAETLQVGHIAFSGGVFQNALLTDLVMPEGVSGHELAQRLRADRPGLKVIYTSGYSTEFAGGEFALSSDEAFLQKPFSTGALLEATRRCLDG